MFKLFSRLMVLLLLGLASLGVDAQVTVQLELNQQVFMQFEPIFAKVKIRNFSGHPLVFGANKELSGQISFQIYGPKGDLIELRGEDRAGRVAMSLDRAR